MTEKPAYRKPALTFEHQINQLIKRNLHLTDIHKLEEALKHIGYYRLSGYWKIYEICSPLSKEPRFIEGTSLEKILNIYDFDRKLRLLFLDALEKIEISMKARINNYMALRYSPFWFTEEGVFKAKYQESAENIFLKNKALNDPLHKFIIHFREKYKDPSPPSWMILEILNFGDISRIYSFLKNSDAKEIRGDLETSPRIIKSWLRSLTVTRNICAHHGRLWNREFTLLAEFSKELKKAGFERGRLGEQVLIILYFLEHISSNSQWFGNLSYLIGQTDKLYLNYMGMRKDWEDIIRKIVIKSS